MSALRVFVCDDSPTMRRVIRLLLDVEGDLEAVGEAANGRELLETAPALEPDVVVLDLSMPDMNGLEALPELVRLLPGTGVLVYSGFAEASMAGRALELGAHAYLEKDGDPAALAGAIRRVANGRD